MNLLYNLKALGLWGRRAFPQASLGIIRIVNGCGFMVAWTTALSSSFGPSVPGRILNRCIQPARNKNSSWRANISPRHDLRPAEQIKWKLWINTSSWYWCWNYSRVVLHGLTLAIVPQPSISFCRGWDKSCKIIVYELWFSDAFKSIITPNPSLVTSIFS